MTWKPTLLRRVGRIAEPQLLFPLIAMVLLAVVWGATGSLIRFKFDAAEQASTVSGRELLDTYEAQVVRALREIDQTLNLIDYWHLQRERRGDLASLAERGLLPPDVIFVVSIADSTGAIIDSTRPFERRNVGEQSYFREQREADRFAIGESPDGPSGNARLAFSRRLTGSAGTFDGVVIVEVDAGYFVSGYDADKLGNRGVLGILGVDGVFRVRRTGDTIFSGDRVDYGATVPDTDSADTQVRLVRNDWDGVERWTGAREIFGFPIAVLVGLSAQEQLSSVRAEARRYLWTAALGSVVILLLTGVFGRMSVQLAVSRQRELEARVEHARRIEHLAYHDGLTGLPNRSLFSKLLDQSIREAQRYRRVLAVAFLDLDRFKHINDTLGHEAGDQLLQEVARRLKACVRQSDSVARLGGDEFVVLLPEISEEKSAQVVAQSILSACARPFTLIGQEFRVTVSIGISLYPRDGLDEQTLTKNADIAMYQAKSEGKNNFQIYSAKLNAQSLERLALESSLRHALQRNEFRIHYQAKRDIAGGRVTGVEALLRWEHPDLGTVAPMRFIPVAEETGIIAPIGRWVLRTVCAQNVAWQRQGLPPITVAVNLTSRQFFDEHLLQDVVASLEAAGMDPQLLELEIAERVVTQDVEKTLRVLRSLKTAGIRIAIDDFGTGYASLATLQRFPIDTIKIDRSFIRNLDVTPGETALTDAIIAMGKSLSLTVVAQGVETREQAELLRTHACDELQGFYFKKPLPVEDFTELLVAQSAEALAPPG
ncbi:MAG: EAL domain-containing protein [Pseudomonadota bacterium]|nr:EAL domain-containing protein [Pseudomonadota bacterium]